MFKFPVYEPDLSGNIKKYVDDCIDSGWISSKGKYVDLFEQKFCEQTGSSHAISVSNGTVALHLALLALGIKQGDEVIVPTFTYVASVNAITYVGAKPVFVDSLAETWQMDPNDVARKITSKTRAIMAVHLYGASCDLQKIKEIANKSNLFLIEDAAEAFGTLYDGKQVGNFGDIATFSFFGNKTITTGEGGMVVTQSVDLAQKCRKIRGQGLAGTKEYWHDIVGHNFRMTNICAAIGCAQLEKADEIIKSKRDIASMYKENLVNLPLRFYDEYSPVRSSFWMNCIQLEKSSDRDPLRSYLNNMGVETRPTFYPVHTMPMYTQYTDGEYPVSESIASRGINLPSSPLLNIKDIIQITGLIKEYFN